MPTINISEETRILLNRAKSKLIGLKPNQSKFSANTVVSEVLKKYLGEVTQNGNN